MTNCTVDPKLVIYDAKTMSQDPVATILIPSACTVRISRNLASEEDVRNALL